MREEGDCLLEVIGAGLVDVEVAGAAAVAGEAGQLGSADVAYVGGSAIVLRLQKNMSVGEVSPVTTRRHECGQTRICVLWVWRNKRSLKQLSLVLWSWTCPSGTNQLYRGTLASTTMVHNIRESIL